MQGNEITTQTYCRVAPSLGALDADHEYGIPGHTRTWGTINYERRHHKKEPTVFFGMYDLRDYIALWRHKGKKWILWAGADLENLKHGFVFNDGKLKLLSKLLRGNWWVLYIIRDAEHWVEDLDEASKLAQFGIQARMAPSFMGDVSQFPVTYKQFHNPNVYISGHPGREDEYGFEIVKKIAPQCPDLRFHIYGSMPDWKVYSKNIILHGKVPREQFNSEIRNFQCGLRLNKSDGFSEITAKAVLMGQYPITYLYYPLIPNFKELRELVSLLKSLKQVARPNIQARDYYLKVLNSYPWNIKK
jgi:hypothetical protein